MKRSRFPHSQVLAVLKQADVKHGSPVPTHQRDQCPVIALARLPASTRTDIPRIVDRLKELIKYKDFKAKLRRVRRDGTTQRG